MRHPRKGPTDGPEWSIGPQGCLHWDINPGLVPHRRCMRKLISIFSPAYNEEGNIRRCYEAVRDVMAALADRYDYEHLFADNCSEDGTLALLRQIAVEDPHVRVLAYSRNFGSEKSGMTLLRHTRGDAVICVVSDLQDPPEVIPQFIEAWEKGFDVVWGVYINEGDGPVMRICRELYYKVLDRLSEERIPQNHSGFGLFTRRVIDEVIAIDDHAPYIRGMIACVGFDSTEVIYRRKGREKGSSHQRFRFLLGFGMNAIVSHSLVPLRMATFFGGALAVVAILMAFAYAIIKICNWNFQAPGATTTVVLVLFFSGVQLFFLGMIGEYIGAIHKQVRRKPYVIIKEKINFDE